MLKLSTSSPKSCLNEEKGACDDVAKASNVTDVISLVDHVSTLFFRPLRIVSRRDNQAYLFDCYSG